MIADARSGIAKLVQNHGLGETFEDIEVERSLENIARVEQNDVLFLCSGLFDDRGDSGQATVSLSLDSGRLFVSMNVVAMKNRKGQRFLCNTNAR